MIPKQILMTVISSFLLFVSHGQTNRMKHPADDSTNKHQKSITIQPGIGLRPNFGKDLMLTNLITLDIATRLSLATHTSISNNNLTHRRFNYIRTTYDYTISQTIGIGTTKVGKKASHSLFLMAGVKYYNFKQSLENPNYESVSTSISSISPDMGMRYNFTYGVKKCFFHAGLYLPLYPYPIKTINIESADGNLHNISLEAGLGIKL